MITAAVIIAGWLLFVAAILRALSIATREVDW